ncbi:hypothetical protein AMTRI_Chr01g109010 [Amborella trichopoda]|uniref:THUMP domain-containing protein n=1 Tax=Amborella trichopoda TaxID=13333 RepID=W1PBX7_AMBTC|nr:THUMP domain-containing protein 1 homolog [Amborella trichopoda]ERN05116.1 hypothetical protein AMTR_s00053p00166720 [Amborella trichopoda]|eukprot:XP_006843441.1 THUMP domain-containing protein 1 homolog [Amborella trichopoda]
MAVEGQTKSVSNDNNDGRNKKRKSHYLPHNRPTKKGSYPLRPGVQGFFVTCDGGRERQATTEAINLLDKFYEELLHGEDSTEERISSAKSTSEPAKVRNNKIRFKDSDSSSDDESETHPCNENGHNKTVSQEGEPDLKKETPIKKQHLETGVPSTDSLSCNKTDKKSIDKLLEAELEELGDRDKRHFVSLDSGCNAVIFIQMHKKEGGPCPADIVSHVMKTAAATRKHMSRFILRLLPVEVTCYASGEEISKAIKPLIDHYYPSGGDPPQKFAVLYDARANTGIERAAIIDSVAKAVPQPHKVDLNNPDKTIVVQIVKTICLVGVVEKYKEWSKYNLRQLSSPPS